MKLFFLVFLYVSLFASQGQKIEIFDDIEFQCLVKDEKIKIIKNYFNEKLVDRNFSSLSKEQQINVVNNFVNMQLKSRDSTFYLHQIREKYPMYSDIDDYAFAKAVKCKDYSNIDNEVYFKLIGLDKKYSEEKFKNLLIRFSEITSIVLVGFFIFITYKHKEKIYQIYSVKINNLEKKFVNLNSTRGFQMEKVVKIVAVIVVVFIMYLWSGGIWQYADLDEYPKRVNKITGTYEVLDQDGKWKKFPF